MTDQFQGTAEDDLQFLRSLVEETRQEHVSRASAFVLTCAGFLFGGQVFFHWLERVGAIPTIPALTYTVFVGTTLTFLAINGWVSWQRRKNGGDKSVSARVISGAFAGGAFTILCLIIVFVSTALRWDNFEVAMFFPAVVAALQGAIWYLAAMVKRKLWLGMVSGGWFITAMALGLLVQHSAYFLVLSGALFAFMGAPGLYMMRRKD